MCNISANSLHPYQRAEGITYENAKPDYTTKEEKQQDEPEQEMQEYDPGFDYMNPQTYVDLMKNAQGKLETMSCDDAKTGTLKTMAMYINARAHLMKGDAEKPSYADFDTDTEEIMNSPSFKETVQDYGGTSVGALNRIADNAVKTGCKQFFGNFIQNLHHEKQREESFQKIKDDYAENIQRSNTFDKTADIGKTLKATPHDHRLWPLCAICLPNFRHNTQFHLVLRQ
ncbi:hypothetical protein [Ruminococcus sp. NK3A76]|uniref:hypothetical protein n=1 Tax=Ruminococcus sp. NK3A76 TaxID=877411 RepID=UPI00048A7245|nr:hypothetical protein [Ruminococcus sp. NK3A76]